VGRVYYWIIKEVIRNENQPGSSFPLYLSKSTEAGVMTEVDHLDRPSRDRYQELKSRIGLVSFSTGRQPIEERLQEHCQFEVNGGVEIPRPEGPGRPVPVVKCYGAGAVYNLDADQDLYAVQWEEPIPLNAASPTALIFSRYPQSDSIMNALALIRLIQGFNSHGVDQEFSCVDCGTAVHWSTIIPPQKHLVVVHIRNSVIERTCCRCIKTGRRIRDIDAEILSSDRQTHQPEVE
jgi:hypothetical protein